MTVYDRTASGGTVGHPSRMPAPYVITSPVWDTVDGGGVGGDIIQIIDLPADTMIISGVLEVLEASQIIFEERDFFGGRLFQVVQLGRERPLPLPELFVMFLVFLFSE